MFAVCSTAIACFFRVLLVQLASGIFPRHYATHDPPSQVQPTLFSMFLHVVGRKGARPDSLP
jgi:hypothetical protein